MRRSGIHGTCFRLRLGLAQNPKYPRGGSAFVRFKVLSCETLIYFSGFVSRAERHGNFPKVFFLRIACNMTPHNKPYKFMELPIRCAT